MSPDCGSAPLTMYGVKTGATCCAPIHAFPVIITFSIVKLVGRGVRGQADKAIEE